MATSHRATRADRSDHCLVVTETDHVDKLYIPESAVRWEHFVDSDHTTVCPFKGMATYWSLSDTAAAAGRNVMGTYQDPLTAVDCIRGHVSFYDTDVRVVVVERWPDGSGSEEATPFAGFSMTGRELRIVDSAYDPDPDRVGPTMIKTWARFRDDPGAL